MNLYIYDQGKWMNGMEWPMNEVTRGVLLCQGIQESRQNNNTTVLGYVQLMH